jgi:hypothetical protein
VITEQKQIDILLKDFELIQSWFDKYDELIFKGRGWLISIIILVMGFNDTNQGDRLLNLVIYFSLFLLIFEIIWMFSFWKKRAERHIEIKLFVNQFSSLPKTSLDKINLLNPTHSSKSNNSKEIDNKHIIIKILEPMFFYCGIILIALLFRFI